jgi:6-pyruvoyltetrahydropterin/6-carboxytetrahydropterin synthase
MIVSKKFSFDAAHSLPKYEGKCNRLHGHHWVVELACSGYVAEDTGMVVDFNELKKFCNIFEEKFDHTCLNEISELWNPTAENICKYIYDEFNMWCVAHKVDFEFIRIWETPNSMVQMQIGR